MPYKKGESGNPRGRPPKGQTITDRLRKALSRKYGGQTTADLIVNAAVRLAAQGDMRAIAFITERLDGKVPTPIEQISQVHLVVTSEQWDVI